MPPSQIKRKKKVSVSLMISVVLVASDVIPFSRMICNMCSQYALSICTPSMHHGRCVSNNCMVSIELQGNVFL
ncbi:hypothetical protein AX774_g4563 [Zancudomyces culisetae]|uniref:Uncharacterized protein n=1 Tax=Zancudomyces culisetae TaxID=1213189 RepID=A0A1R1PM06_ZANCU|nr:hypothetical protein AX774_g4563 [Zancudomyces culisetae]|eukprot:OMH81977.1 hypothetical protein AX774_g4563 [Zancudomyces culisetae]